MAVREPCHFLLITSMFSKGSSECHISIKIPYLVWVQVDNDSTVSSWPFNCVGNSECSFHTKAQIISYSPFTSGDLLLITEEESGTHCLLWISVPSRPKAEARSKNTRSTNHCKSVLMVELNIDTILFFLLPCIEHTLHSRPFISIFSVNPHHDHEVGFTVHPHLTEQETDTG